ncbi:MAG: T9SS type A sorting domain-containing protein, partial [Spirosomaceae bacterium]|nr:T9SS type A sorting domain-containing protein [Spirosomataceae bacterium]
LTQSLPAFNEAVVTLTADFLNRLQSGQSYQFLCRTRLVADQDTLNDLLNQTRTVAAETVVANVTATYCDTDPASLISRAAGVAYWYDTPTNAVPLAVGNFASSARQPNNTFFVALNDFSGRVGPVTKSAFTGGSYSGAFGPQPFIKTDVPLVLESARLYTASTGKITFTVQGLDDSFISSVTIDTKASRNATAPNTGVPAGQFADDPNDPGEVYALNLPIPTPGDYKIAIEYEDGATIFRSNSGVTGFPFRIPNVITIRGALSAQNNRVDTLTNAYYYLYDLKVTALGCPSPRVAVMAQTATKTAPTVAFDGPNAICEGGELALRTPANAGVYQWFLNNQPIRNAAAATYNATVAGTYTVSTSVNNCLPTLSAPVMLTTRRPEKPTVTVDGITLQSNVMTSNQWFLNGLPIQGATNRTLTAFQTGNYAVRANANGCGELLSDDVRIVVTSLEEEPSWRGVGARAYPNPTRDRLVCEFQNESTKGNVQVTLYDATGRLLKEQSMEKIGRIFRTEFNLQNLENGTFFATIQEESADTRTVLKIVKNP